MKILRRILIMSLTVISTLSAVSCADKVSPSDAVTTEATTEATTETTTEAATEPSAPPALSIAGTDISQFTIIYARNKYYRVLNSLTDLIKGEYDYDRITAEKLAAAITDRYGVTLAVAQDTKTAATEHEILVGKTNRETALSSQLAALKTDDYRIDVTGGKITVCGGDFGTTWHAAEALCDLIAAENSISYAEGNVRTDTYHMKYVACVGDSITYGSTSTDPKYLSYPANLERMLWRDYVIVNYGHGGKTMRNDLADAYRGCNEYNACMENAAAYDVVLIMLGTNDSNRDRDWSEADSIAYNDSAVELIDKIKAKNADVGFVIMNCPVYYGSSAFGTPKIRQLQSDLVTDLSAKGYKIELFDMYTYTKDVMGQSLFPDKLHPADAGYVVMAAGVRDMLVKYFQN